MPETVAQRGSGADRGVGGAAAHGGPTGAPAEGSPDAWVDRALALHKCGQTERAIAACDRALSEAPDHARGMLVRAFLLQTQGRLDEAAGWHRRVLELAESDGPAGCDAGMVALAHQGLGAILAEQGDPERAVVHYRQALELLPEDAPTWDNLGVVLEALGRDDEALEAYRQAALLDSSAARVWFHLGNVLRRTGRATEAAARYRRALGLQADWPECWNNLGAALQDGERFEEAINAFRRAVDAEPGNAEYLNNLGLALYCAERTGEAIGVLRRALAADNGLAEAHWNLADALRDEGELEAALGHYRRALRLRPDYSATWWNLGLALLTAGRLREGFALYHWRRHPEVPIETYPHVLAGPRWDGSRFAGRTLLIHCEQGFGDAIQCLRFVPQVKVLGGRIVLEVPGGLLRLAERLDGVDRFVVFDPRRPPEVAYDLHASVMDLPALLHVTEATIPQTVPYMHVPEALVARWRGRFDARRYHVGLIWAGNPKHRNDRNRSCPAEAMAALGAASGAASESADGSGGGAGGVCFWSLQVGPGVEQLGRLRQRLAVEDLSGELTDFAETAAAMRHLDLVVSVDTAAAHLAGALGRPVWLAIPFVPDWRWGIGRTDSPWYPTMRIFRQPRRGAWGDVFEAMAGMLRQRVRQWMQGAGRVGGNARVNHVEGGSPGTECISDGSRRPGGAMWTAGRMGGRGQ